MGGEGHVPAPRGEASLPMRTIAGGRIVVKSWTATHTISTVEMPTINVEYGLPMYETMVFPIRDGHVVHIESCGAQFRDLESALTFHVRMLRAHSS